MTRNRIVRHTNPTKFDKAPFGTLCQVNSGDDASTLYIQLSEHEEAQWEPIGFLLENAFEELLQDPEFIEELLHLIGSHEYKSFASIADILKKKTVE